jgi:tetratricopeptide (TPR) repeat protein
VNVRPFLAALFVLLALGCSKSPPEFEEVAPADELWAEGQRILEGGRLLGIIPRTDYAEAISTFQAIIDNYPYSEYAVKAELAIADAYFDDGKYEEALSYYRDFTDLHPQHEQVPYAIYRSALSYERRVRSANRDQTATREAINYLDRLLATYPYSGGALSLAAQRVPGPGPRRRRPVQARGVLRGDEPARGGRGHLPGHRAELPGRRRREGRRGPHRRHELRRLHAGGRTSPRPGGATRVQAGAAQLPAG